MVSGIFRAAAEARSEEVVSWWRAGDAGFGVSRLDRREHAPRATWVSVVRRAVPLSGAKTKGLWLELALGF